MAILNRLDKRTGITYVYESSSYWDKKKKQPRCKRTLIGKIDPETGEMIPTDGRCKHLSTEGRIQALLKKEQEIVEQQSVREEEDQRLLANTRRTFCGATYLLDAIAEKTGLSADLKRCFPKEYRQLLSLAYYLLLYGESSNLPFYYRKLAGNIPDVKNGAHTAGRCGSSWHKQSQVIDG